TGKILDANPNLDRYQLAIAVAARADELLNGAPSKLSASKNIKAADLALMEIAEGLIIIKSFADKS
ncbi:MAG: DNA-directed RNA polymerase subunit omega, partial [Sulfurimonas sp.]